MAYQKEKSSVKLLILLGALMAFTSLSTDVFLPAMPEISHDLSSHAPLLITSFLVGFAVAQLFWGPISDKYGRKIPLLTGIFLFIIGSVGCALANDMFAMIIFRIIQAVGACTGPMIARAVVRDLYSGIKAARVFNVLMIIMSVAPIVGPLIGGQLLSFFSWRAIFTFMAIVGLALFISTLFLKETLSQTNRRRDFSGIFNSYFAILRNKIFMLSTLVVSSFYLAIYAFISASPSVYIEHFNVDSRYYGFLFGINVLGLTIVSVFNRRLIDRVPLFRLVITTILFSFLISLVMLIMNSLNDKSLLSVAVPIFIIFSSNGIIASATNAIALSYVPSNSVGIASALLGSFQYGSGIISSLLLSIWNSNHPIPMAWIIFGGLFLASIFAIRLSSQLASDNKE
ncbi:MULTISPECIES: multidrug effflux MFS transporter [Leuconostoc]|uniref:multidrug effflux MFS transporter n=1 Tax=Leuconostoc TaxID=1243 RepID=UPI001B8C374C|nr:multidrug effflux MFS transporter [Leuconostoc mesenteroides]MBS1008163.1 multidrug effflux MFS transporter [Leuconostoc suionicum]